MSPTFRSNVETQTNKANLEDLNCGAETPVTLDESFALQTFALAIMSSLPQPTIAVPVFFFVEHFIAWESVALGFAAGAMWVACFELLADAMQEVSASAPVPVPADSMVYVRVRAPEFITWTGQQITVFPACLGFRDCVRASRCRTRMGPQERRKNAHQVY